MGRFDGKVALVTGASRGIGRGIALQLATEGADVVVNYRTHPDEAREVADLITGMGRRALVWQADVADRAAMEAMFAGTVEHFGRLDVVVACGFVGAPARLRSGLADHPAHHRSESVRRLPCVPTGRTADGGASRTGAAVARSWSSVRSTPSCPCPTARPTTWPRPQSITLPPPWPPLTPRIHQRERDQPGLDRHAGRAQFTEEQMQAGAARMPWGRKGTADIAHAGRLPGQRRSRSSPAPPCASTAGMCWGCGFRSKKNRNED
ncbi:MAG: SDR family NAD(P)-dependent oxidoreductase [Caldilineaceae bacterium]